MFYNFFPTHFFLSKEEIINPIQDGVLTDGVEGRGVGQKGPFPKICHTYPTMMKLGTVIPYLKKFQKLYESHDTPLGFCWHQHFFTGNQQILLYQEIQKQIPFKYIIFLTFLESLKVVLINMATVLMISAKMATPDLLKTKIFWKKGYDVTISDHDVISPILSRNSNYNVNAVMWPKVGNCSIFVTSIL